MKQEDGVPEVAQPLAPTPLDLEAARKQAFACVAQLRLDDLGVILDGFSPAIWTLWENKAGDDLLSISKRRSDEAHKFLLKRLGVLQERNRTSFSAGDTVWVLGRGDVESLRVTVMEDTPAESDEVPLRFWDKVDGEDEAGCKLVQRDKISK